MPLFESQDKRIVRAQLDQLQAQRYEVVVRTAEDQIQHAELSARDTIDLVPWLRGLNDAGAQIRIRPAEPTPLVLVTHLRREDLERMAGDGFPPVLAERVRAGHYEAWVQLDKTPLPAGLHTALAQTLADRYGGEVGRAGPQQTGFLAPFVNPWDGTRDGRPVETFPVEMMRGERGEAPAAADLRREILEHMVLPRGYLTSRAAIETPERDRVPDRGAQRDATRGEGARAGEGQGRGDTGQGRAAGPTADAPTAGKAATVAPQRDPFADAVDHER